MKRFIAFFEIPAADFSRAVEFYSKVFNLQLPTNECAEEKMACFMEDEECVGAISWAKGFNPSAEGVLIHFNCQDIKQTLSKVIEMKGKVIIPKTKIQAEGRGWFAVFADSEGNHIGLYQ